jgi:hypothetical protein
LPFSKHLCPGGEIGRHTGLKILRRLNSVPVRFRLRAPSNKSQQPPKLLI